MWPAPYERTSRSGFIRGLFSGGTLCDEAMAIAAECLGPIASNTPLQAAWALGDDLRAHGPSHDRLRRRQADRGKAASDDRPVTSAGTDRAGGGRPRVCCAPSRRRPRIRVSPGSCLASSRRPSPPPGRAPSAAAAISPSSSRSSGHAPIRRVATPPPKGSRGGRKRSLVQCRGCPGSGGPRRGSGPMIELDESPAMVTVGASLFADALIAQMTSPLQVQWAPPVPGSDAHLALIAADGRTQAATAESVRRLTAASPHWVDVVPARRGAEPRASGVPACWTTGHLGRCVRPDPWGIGRSHDLRGSGRELRAGRPDRCSRRHITRTVPLPLPRSARWPASSARRCRCQSSRMRKPAGGPTAP